jgi:catechol 2,3-dioxygenase-like lactoylglutathione lyase family enzyme
VTHAMTIPVLPCVSLDETLDFYRLLGFQPTYRQTTPNPYAVVEHEGAQLHFAGVKGLKPTEAYTTCLVIVPEVERLHQAFAEALRRVFGKLPISGLPRISRMRKGQSRFTVVDPAGNSVIFIRRNAPDDYDEGQKPPSSSRLGKALRTAARLRDFKGDDLAAAKVLDVALARDEPALPIERARALAARAELAIALGDETRARTAREELQRIPLSDEEREQVREELEAADPLDRTQR